MRKIVAEDLIAGLAYRIRFSGKCRLIDAEVIFLHKTGICRNAVSFGQQNNVAWNQLFSEQLLLLAIPYYPRIIGQHLSQSLYRFTGAEFLPKTENAVNDIDQPDRHGKFRHLRYQGYESCHPQQDRHQMRKAGNKFPYNGSLFLLRQFIFSIPAHAFLRLGS